MNSAERANPPPRGRAG